MHPKRGAPARLFYRGNSQAIPQNFLNVFEEVAQAGDSAVVITLASKLSGTYQSAVIAAAEYENIYIVDSKHLWEQGLKEVRYTCIGSIIGTHAGPGAVAVAFFKKSG